MGTYIACVISHHAPLFVGNSDQAILIVVRPVPCAIIQLWTNMYLNTNSIVRPLRSFSYGPICMVVKANASLDIESKTTFLFKHTRCGIYVIMSRNPLCAILKR